MTRAEENKHGDIARAPTSMRLVADYLVAAPDLTTRSGVLDGSRVDFFKGKHGINAVLRSRYQEQRLRVPSLPATRTRGDAADVLQKLLEHGFVYPVHRLEDGKTLRRYMRQEAGRFSEDTYYVWVYRPSQWQNTLLGVAVLLVVFGGVLAPMWPAFLKLGAYYLSLTALGVIGLLFTLCIVRLVLYAVVRATTGKQLWLFPNLLADVGFVDSFIPMFG